MNFKYFNAKNKTCTISYCLLYILTLSGSYECKLCLTLHNNEGSYLAHTQGKKHQANLARRAAKEAKEAPQQLAPEKPRIEPKKFVKIGRPGYRVTKQKDPENGQQSLLFQVDYPGWL